MRVGMFQGAELVVTCWQWGDYDAHLFCFLLFPYVDLDLLYFLCDYLFPSTDLVVTNAISGFLVVNMVINTSNSLIKV